MSACPEREEFERFCAAQAAPDRAAEIETHITACASCAELLERISRSALRHVPFEVQNTRADRPPDPPGYELLESAGAGGMGVVWKARQRELGRVVALKFIGGHPGAGAELRERLRAEAEAVARLQHPNIVQIFEARFPPGADGFLAMEFLDGGTLRQRLDGRPLAPDPAATLVRDLTRAVAHAHERGIVHRDLKPGNVLFAADGTPKVADFGLAKVLDADPRTDTGRVLGTPDYMSPEQTRGVSGPPTDVYALGVILYECLTGRTPFRGVTPVDTLALIRDTDPVPVRRLVASAPADLETVALKCLAKPPGERYPSAAALADDLQRYLERRPVLARPPSWAYQFRKFAARRKVLVGGLAATFVSLTGGLIGTTAALARARREEADRVTAEGERDAEKGLKEEAERRARLRLADALFAAGQNALQRGQWRDAVALVDEALAVGYPKPARARLVQVKAWYALNEMTAPDKRAVLDGLRREPDFAEQEGSVLLYQGDMLLGQDNAAAVEHVREARRKGGLSPADAAYADALLAESVAAAVGHCSAAVGHEPYHYRARLLRFMCRFLSGRLEQAEQEAAVMREFFPADPAVVGVQMMVDTLRGRHEEAAAGFGMVERVWAPAQVDQLRVVLFALNELVLLDPWQPDTKAMMARLMAAKINAFALLGLRTQPENFAPLVGLLPAVPPLLAKAVGDAVRALSQFGQPRPHEHVRPAAETLERVVPELPEGTLLLMLGLARVVLEEFAAAEPWFRQAAIAHSLKPVRKLALFAAGRCAWVTGIVGRKSVVPEARDRLRGYYLQLLREDALPDYMYPQMIEQAVAARDYDLARQVGLAYGARLPDDPWWRYHLARAESAGGDPFAALRLLDAVRAGRPPKELADAADAAYAPAERKCREQAEAVLKRP
jgi:tetratricopeptide (TPR) repeat protein